MISKLQQIKFMSEICFRKPFEQIGFILCLADKLLLLRFI